MCIDPTTLPLADNPYLVRTNYQSTLDAIPEPFRSLLLGGFRTALKDQDNQVCPTPWVKAAMARWKPDGWKAYTMTAMALDPAGGGDDPPALAARHGPWFAPLVMLKGEATRDGAQMAATMLAHRRANAALVVDMGGGFGTDVTSRLKENGIAFVAFNGANKSSGASMGKLKFYNARAEAWWRFREELSPDREGGSEIALPNDPELLADLKAPTFEVRTSGILIESKDDIRKRLGRSTNKGDAVVMCLAPGNQAVKGSSVDNAVIGRVSPTSATAPKKNACAAWEDASMGDDAEPIEATAASTDARGAMRLAQIEADQAHGEQLLQRYGRTELRQRFAVLGHANMKQRRRRR